MAYEGTHAVKLNLKAGADLSSDQYKFVKLNADNQVIKCAAATDKPIGVLQNEPDASGKAAEVVCVGVTKVEVGESLSAGDLTGTAADGQAEKKEAGTDTSNFIAGQIIDGASSAGEMATAVINCANIARAA